VISPPDGCRDGNTNAWCPLHAGYRGRRDAELAAEVGRAWARYRWHSRDVRERWPDFEGDQVERATRATSWLALRTDEPRRHELAKHANHSAGFAWEELQCSIPNLRDAPYRPPSRAADVHVLEGNEHAHLMFRAGEVEQQRDALSQMLDRATAKARCPACSSRSICAKHADCAAHRDASLASEIGERWAQFAWQTSWHIARWPSFEGRSAALATALVVWLPARGDDTRLRALAEICSWRAAMTWEAIHTASMGRFQHTPAVVRTAFPLPSAEQVVIKFRSRSRRARVAST
jgi:hypothetical protein